MTTNDERIAALFRAGWQLIEAPSAGADHEKARTTPSYTFERYFNGSRIHEIGETLESALDRAEWQQSRLESLDDKPVVITTGLDSTATSKY